ncbi:MAG: NADH-quinone oxidoreductase subunit NuoH [Deltaproteobacteria bacterium]|nr:NADH-quinone oxidoreductase subunit NuoH [Deltaproteobacteria bacterium]
MILFGNPWLHGLVVGAVLLGVLLGAAAWSIWWERKFSALLQNRYGVNVVGPYGLLQPLADAFKMFQKEDLTPARADKVLYNMAPPMVLFCVLGTLAVVPITSTLAVANLDIGVLFMIALGSMTVIPLWMAGWASNNKYALLGGMRAVAQSIAYEIPLVLSALVPVVLAGSMNITEIANAQAGYRWYLWWPAGPGLLAGVIFLLASLAEANRIPFDVPEAESELIAGVSVEYTGMKFGMFLLTEYLHTIITSIVVATLFMGGWDGPFLPGLHWTLIKTFLVFTLITWIRWSWVRLRSDQLMRLCWKWFLPLSLVALAWAAVWVRFFPGGTP